MRDLSEPERERFFKVDLLYDGRRLDKFLRHKMRWKTRGELQKRIRDGFVLVNGKEVKPSRILREGDVVFVKLDVPEVDLNSIPIDVLFEDDEVMVVNKPAGFMVHPTGRHVFGTLLNAIYKRMKDRGEIDAGYEPLLCHRLDKNTTGALLLAKKKDARRILQEAFEAGDVGKVYISLVEGMIDVDGGELDYPLAVKPGEKCLKMDVKEWGYPSLTVFTVRERFPLGDGFSLVECDLKTGRTHQIRAHLAHFGHPVLCDEVYGVRTELKKGDLGLEPKDKVLFTRQALHSFRLAFPHPKKREVVEVEAPLPTDIRMLLSVLRKAMSG